MFREACENQSKAGVADVAKSAEKIVREKNAVASSSLLATSRDRRDQHFLHWQNLLYTTAAVAKACVNKRNITRLWYIMQNMAIPNGSIDCLPLYVCSFYWIWSSIKGYEAAISEADACTDDRHASETQKVKQD